jgi:shikimate dehydrogenase
MASLTPQLHEVEAAALGIPYEYRIFDLTELGRPPRDIGPFLAEASRSGYAAMNITHPCKQLVLDVVDELDPDAERLQAVNLVVFEDGRLVGYNTDWMGFQDGLAAGLPDASVDRVVQIGCGGAGSATAYALLASGTSRLGLFDVDHERAWELGDRMRTWFPDRIVEAIPEAALSDAISQASGVVHATPLGMRHHPGVAFDVTLLSPEAWVSDVVYRPLITELIRTASEQGNPVLDGGRMAVGQAYASLRIITGERPDRDRMERHFRDLVGVE